MLKGWSRAILAVLELSATKSHLILPKGSRKVAEEVPRRFQSEIPHPWR